MKGRRGEQSCLFQRQFSLTKPKRGEKKRVKRETRRKTCSPKVGGGGGHIWYRALLECDWMLCCGGLFANLYLHKNSQRWKMPSEGAWELRGFGLGGRDGWERSCLFLSACWTFFSERKGTSNGRSVRWVGGEGWNHPEWTERGKGWSWRGTSPGRGEWMTVKGGGGGGWRGGFRRFIHGLLCLNPVTQSVSLWSDPIRNIPSHPNPWPLTRTFLISDQSVPSACDSG